ncbi:lysophospholipid acyltransferase family protein [Saliterribacillus persicus]|uniref:1-acyl-sn-glycerol-3-phosphate acyltransferase n=1 Tax=Saliterribacillus persicus TaxID=930114 RepID=A0A368X4Q7_9BACI|nr:lysophospholipid acyltransferase family protein [Saliterribacillus persicus]RCW63001.1 1-acyl-sn-glycerol-3-phosphate acyltransferase [Saliterribacillus persicus]
MRTLWIYTYAAIIVFNTLPKLRKVKKLSKEEKFNQQEEIFQTAQQVSEKVIKKTKTTVEVHGKENLPDGPALYVANHQGLFDILLLLGYLDRPIGFIAKKEIKRLPIISSWMEEIGCVFIDRANKREAIKVMAKGIENLKDGYSLVIFPEGTRSKGASLKEFKAGSLRLGTKAKVPIVPIAIDGTYHMLEGNDGAIKPAHVQMWIHKPIDPEVYQTQKNVEIMENISEEIRTTLLKNTKE